VSPDLRAGLAEFVEQIDTYGASDEDSASAVRLCDRYDEETRGKGLPDNFILNVNEWTAYAAFERACEEAGIELPE
jgi:hypothetical protein